jgi:hypothetical protein
MLVGELEDLESVAAPGIGAWVFIVIFFF